MRKAKTKFEKYFLRFVFILFVFMFPIKILIDIFPKGLEFEIREYKLIFYDLWRR